MEEEHARRLLVPLLFSWVVSKKPGKLVIQSLANYFGLPPKKKCRAVLGPGP